MKVSSEVLGDAIGRARLDARLSRGQIQRATRGRFTATAIGGYERGDRAISVVRFVELAYAIGVSPEELLASALDCESPRAHHRVTIDLARLGEADPAVRDTVAGFVRRMQVRRSDFLTDVLTLRAGDLAVVAGSAEVSPAELMRSLAPAVVTSAEHGEPARR